MSWSDIAGLVGKAAPILSTLIAGPAGAAVGGILASALGTDSTPEALERADKQCFIDRIAEGSQVALIRMFAMYIEDVVAQLGLAHSAATNRAANERKVDGLLGLNPLGFRAGCY